MRLPCITSGLQEQGDVSCCLVHGSDGDDKPNDSHTQWSNNERHLLLESIRTPTVTEGEEGGEDPRRGGHEKSLSGSEAESLCQSWAGE